MKNQDDQIFYRRHLPHYQPLDAIFFITFRLNGSLPLEVVQSLKKEREEEEKLIAKIKDENEQKKLLINCRKAYFGKFDTLLDNCSGGPKWLKNVEIAKIVQEALHYRDQKVYDLFAYTIMPNHVHLVFKPLHSRDKIVGRRGSSPYIATEILENLKWYAALKSNKALNRSGQFWQHESYDHVVRDGKEFERIIWYVLNNPVKAGLAKTWEKWPYSYCKPGLLEM